MTRRGPHYPWEEIILRLTAMPGRWVLHRRMMGVPRSVVDRIRDNKIREFRGRRGKVHARVGNTGWNALGEPVVDIWLRFDPSPERNEYGKQVTRSPSV